MTAITTVDAPGVLGVLARQEIRHYLRSRVYWVGTILLAGLIVATFVDPARGNTKGYNPSSAQYMIGPSALLGLFGVIIMAAMTRRSDRAAAAAGGVAVPERTRTLALAAASVVPLATALVCYGANVVKYWAQPPDPTTVPFGPIGDGDVLTVMFAIGVVPALSGPLLGLLIARWLPRRGMAAFGVVVVVLVTIMLQGNYRSTWHWRVVWPWTGWIGPFGWDTGTTHWIALPGSPQMWLIYLAAVCALGVLVAVYHDPECDRARLRRLVAGVGVVALIALALTMTLGPHEAVYNHVVASR